MRKLDVVDEIASRMHISKGLSKKFLNTFCDVVSDGLKADGEVDLFGVMRFYISERKETMMPNPKTKEMVKVPETKIPRCKFSKALKRYLNE